MTEVAFRVVWEQEVAHEGHEDEAMSQWNRKEWTSWSCGGMIDMIPLFATVGLERFDDNVWLWEKEIQNFWNCQTRLSFEQY